jgi:plasmid stabilization system protein ParE
VGERIQKAADDLAFMSTGRPGRVAGTFEKVVTGLPYIIAYEITTSPRGEECISVLRVIHATRNWPPGRWPDPD